MDYCVLADVKTYQGITSNTTDAVLTALITAASAFIDSYCDRDFAVHSAVTEKRNGTGGTRLVPLYAPILSVSSVSVNGTPILAASSDTGDGFVYDDEVIYLRGATFCRGVQNISIGYSGGFAAVPGDIKQACVELVLYKFAKRDRLDKDMETLNGQNVAFNKADMPAGVRTALNKYRRWMV